MKYPHLSSRIASGAFVAFAACVGLAHGQGSEAPVALVVTYKAGAGSRAAFRHFLETEEKKRLATWQQQGVFRKAQLFFASYAGAAPIDAALVLEFDRYSDTARWREVERTLPGGLSREGLALASPIGSSLVDSLGADLPVSGAARSVYTISMYDLIADPAAYRKYLDGFVKPQIKAWSKEGAVSGYAYYLNQNRAGTAWGVFSVLQYPDDASLGRRDAVKDRVKQALASDAAWSAFVPQQAGMRKETALFVADRLCCD